MILDISGRRQAAGGSQARQGHPTPALVARAQGGLTLGLERGELGADFTFLGGKN